VAGSAQLTAVSDRDLVASALQGDRHAFGVLVCRYQEDLVGVVFRMCGDMGLAEETAQDAFLRAWQRLHLYKPQFPFRSWIFSIAIHLALDTLRREQETVDVDALDLQSAHLGPEGELESKQRAEKVRQAVLALPPASRAVLVLREYQGLSYGEIAGVLGIPTGTVMSRLNYARNHLRQALAADMEVL
jgi:RNA polymerase sigma-70 factor (ECF subfamily)